MYFYMVSVPISDFVRLTEGSCRLNSTPASICLIDRPLTPVGTQAYSLARHLQPPLEPYEPATTEAIHTPNIKRNGLVPTFTILKCTCRSRTC